MFAPTDPSIRLSRTRLFPRWVRISKREQLACETRARGSGKVLEPLIEPVPREPPLASASKRAKATPTDFTVVPTRNAVHAVSIEVTRALR
jgi:hypothetical protein